MIINQLAYLLEIFLREYEFTLSTIARLKVIAHSVFICIYKTTLQPAAGYRLQGIPPEISMGTMSGPEKSNTNALSVTKMLSTNMGQAGGSNHGDLTLMSGGPGVITQPPVSSLSFRPHPRSAYPPIHGIKFTRLSGI